VIPPGQERLVGEMLGGGSDGAPCRLESAAIQQTAIVASYACAGATSRTVTLRHRRAASGAATVTARFAVTAGAEVPHAFLEQVAAGVRSREPGFRWSEPPPRSREGWPWRLTVIGVIAVLAMFLGGPRRRAETSLTPPSPPTATAT
jgi:hypothetical protein